LSELDLSVAVNVLLAAMTILDSGNYVLLLTCQAV